MTPYEKAMKKFDHILECHPGDSPEAAKNRIAVVLQDFGIVRRSTAVKHLKVKEKVDGNFRLIHGFKHICHELIEGGLPARLCYRQRKFGNGEEPCLIKL